MAVQKTYGNVQNEQFQGRHFYVPFREFVHLHMQYCSFVNSILKHLTFGAAGYAYKAGNRKNR